MLDKLSLAGLVPVIKVDQAQDAVPLCKALAEGGLPVAEITFRTAAAEEAIRLVHEALPEVLLGAGTVLSTEQADRAMTAGAGYIVSPGFNPTVVQHCLDKGYPVLPGVSSPSEIEQALSLGVKTVKFFPAEALGGVGMIKALAAPYGELRFVPTGGINEGNLVDYLALPQVVACGGSWMVPSAAIKQGDWARITELTRKAVQLMLGFDLVHLGMNTQNQEEGLKLAGQLSQLLGWDYQGGEKGGFVGKRFEVMNLPFRGARGHVAIGCNDVLRARHYLEQQGIVFDESTLGYGPDGRARVIYFQDEIGGFAFHLMQK